MPNFEVPDTRIIFCNTCRVETHHNLLSCHPRDLYELVNENTPYENIGFWERFEYRLWVCKGCDTGTLEEAYTHEGMINQNEKQVWESNYFPKRKTNDLPYKKFLQLNRKLALIYREVIDCYNSDSKILCTAGLRALLEGICADKEIKGKNLVVKIDGLSNYLPSNIVNSLHSFRFMGNDAVHELKAPKQAELRLAIEVIEDLLNFLYELDYKARKLPQRDS